MTRALRALFFTNDGLGAGHLARTLAIARALRRKVAGLESMLATTSDAHALLAAEPLAAVRWPSPSNAQRSGWPDTVRRAVAARVVRAALESFRPDLLVTDTFPSGPHGELRDLVRTVPRRALVRRSVRRTRAADATSREGISDYDLVILPDDPGECRTESLSIPFVRVPPITLFEAHEATDRDAARKRLGLSLAVRCVLVCSGGGGDANALRRAVRVAHSMLRIPGGPSPVLALGPLTRDAPDVAGIRCIRETPLQPLLAAFDGAIAPAGYNLAHEIAKARVPLALFAMPRPYDDQAGRAARFAKAGIACVLKKTDVASVSAALAWMKRAARPSIVAGGADRAAEALLQLAMGAGA